MKWTDDQIIYFLRLYESFPCLWKTDLPEYKNPEYRRIALQNIILEMNIPGFTERDCKTKIKNIRSHYCQELKKISTSLKHGKKVYKPKLPWFEVLNSFLRPLVVQREEEGVEVFNVAELNSVETQTKEPGSPKEPDTVEDRPKRRAELTPSSRDSNTRTLRSAKKRKQVSTDDLLPKTDVEIPSAPIQRTEFDIFGESIAAQLNNMHFEDAVQLQLEIQQLITRKRMKIIKRR